MFPERCSPLNNSTISIGRAYSIVHRMLAGAGIAEFVAFDIDPGRRWKLLRHGLDDDGVLIVAGVFGPDFNSSYAHRVRLDIRKGAPDLALSMIVSSAHAIGDFIPLTADATDRYLRSGSATAAMIDAATWPGVQIAAFEIEVVHVHDHAGVTQVDVGRIARQHHSAMAHYSFVEQPFPLPTDELLARDLIGEAFGPHLESLQELASMCWGPTQQHGEPMEEGLGTYVTDIDKLGFCVMHVTTHYTRFGFHAFTEPVSSMPGLAAALQKCSITDVNPLAEGMAGDQR